MSGKHIGTSLLIETDSQHLHEKPAYACRIYRFNDYEYRCRASGRAVICRRVFSTALLKCPPHDSQLIESRLEGCRVFASHRGQTRESDVDAKDEPLISCPFFWTMS
jgi:hypothetical protein